MEPTELARIHLECVEKLVGRSFIADWLADTNTIPVTSRGRKPGAAAPAIRCIWTFVNGEQCKNARDKDSTACKIHRKKLHLLDTSTESATATATTTASDV
jgi:hypothetical protein